MTTVFTLAPLGGWLPNWFPELGTNRKAIAYPSWWPSNASAAKGVDALDKALHNTPGDVVVYGHSFGARVIDKWLRERGPTSDVDPGRVRFYCSGNPERKYGGRAGGDYGGIGVPANTPYTVVDIARRGDYWTGGSSMWTHMWYWGVRSDNPADERTTEGHVTYVTTA